MRKLSGKDYIKELVSDRFTEHLHLFTFKYCKVFSRDVTDITQETLGNLFDDPKSIFIICSNYDKLTLVETLDHSSLEKPSKLLTVLHGRCDGKFISRNVIN